MAGKKGADNSKKAAGQARKAEAAANKAATENAKKAAAEEVEWEKGAKNTSKKEAEAARKAEQARKKAERDALLADEEKDLPSRGAPKNKKTAVKKTGRGLGEALEQLDLNDKKLQEGSARNISDAIDLLGLDLPADNKVDKHAERRVKAAYAAFEERRLIEMTHDGSGRGLRLSQKQELIRKEFKKSPENPLNQLRVQHNATQEEIQAAKEREKESTEARLVTST
ncbi:DUF1014-domain-containing protein [Biscogniauxia mediterranea]|nr:DUF1014-domain-containing protein [Biscogniauxia mediterranea]